MHRHIMKLIPDISERQCKYYAMRGAAGNVVFYGTSVTNDTNVAAMLNYEVDTNLPPF